LEPVNFLILDEPTNHLDLKTKDILKEAIKDFDGTVIVVSHDRDFLDGLVEKVYEFGGGKVRENLGGIYDFLRSKNLENLRDLELTKSPTGRQAEQSQQPGQNNTQIDVKPAQNAPKLSYAEQKAREKVIKKAEKKVKDAESEITRLETLQKEIEDKIASGDTSQETLDAYAKAQKDLENGMSVWELATMELEEIKG
ncbi:MAG: ABC transporter ATP-binding protein, partial [Muribaculaceae bacterium]|nr:ABC transporter ATP-binding protein [Muribaculaceae bacterium]